MASSAARAGSGCFRLTARITFQPVNLAIAASDASLAGVTVPDVAQLGAVSPVDVQNVASPELPPTRIVPAWPRVLRYPPRSVEE